MFASRKQRSLKSCLIVARFEVRFWVAIMVSVYFFNNQKKKKSRHGIILRQKGEKVEYVRFTRIVFCSNFKEAIFDRYAALYSRHEPQNLGWFFKKKR